MKHLSASSISLYADCSLKFKFRYIDKIFKPAKSIHLAYGSAIHKALEHFNKSQLQAEIEDIYQVFHDEWIKEITTQELRETQYTRNLYSMGLNALLKFYEDHHDYEIIDTESRFNVPIIYPSGEVEKYTLSGVIDAIIKRKNKLMIVDYKTSKEAYSRFKLDTSIQLALYSYAFRQINEKQKEDYISYYVFIKDYDNLDGRIKMQRKAITNYDRMFYIIKQTVKGIDNKIFLPNTDSMCKYCEFKKECLDFRGTL